MIDKEVFRKTEGRLYRYYRQLKAIANLERELFNKKKKILKLRARIRELENHDIDMDYAIRMLEEMYKQFILLKYRDELSFEQISRELHMSKSTASDWRKKVVIDIAKLLYKSVG